MSYVLVSGAVLWYLIAQLREGQLDHGRQLMLSLTDLVAEQTAATLRVSQELIDAALHHLEDLDPEVEGGVAGVDDQLRQLVADQPAIGSMWILDATGTVIYDAGGNVGMDLSGRTYYRDSVGLEPQPDSSSRPAIGASVASHVDGTWFIPVTKPVYRSDGSYAGVVVAPVRLAMLDQSWQLDYASEGGSVALIHRDGTMMMRSPFTEDAIGVSLLETDLFVRLLPDAPTGVSIGVSPLDRKERMFAYTVIDDYPELIVAVAETTGHLFADWYSWRLLIFVGWAVASTVLLLFAGLLLAELRRRERYESGLASANEALRAEVAERALAERAAEDARLRLMDAIQAVPGGFRLYDSDLQLVLTNDKSMVAPGEQPPRPRVGEHYSAFLRRLAESGFITEAVGREEEWTRTRLEEIQTGLSDRELRLADGRWLHLIESRTSDGGTIILHFDISAHKAVEEQLRQSQKMEAVGQLTGGIAHDFNNMLTVIIGNAEMLEERVADDAVARTGVSTIMRAAQGSAELTQRLLAFARRTTLQPVRLDVSAFLEEIDALLRRTLGEQFDTRAMAEPDTWPVMIDPSQLELAILNLAVNARDAMRDGGKLTIEVANAHIDEVYVAANQDARVGDFVAVSISDTGCGMTAEVVERAFEPFFTTKDVGEGTGLGLSMVYGFVRQSGGHVKIYSEVGSGTTVRLYLPRATTADSPSTGRPNQSAPVPAGCGESILVVEDDELVREHVARQLENLGYTVASTVDGPSALALLADGKSFDLLFTDVVMPGGMSGPDLAQEARRSRPGLKVLFTSGYTKNAIVHGGRIDADARLLNKPYRLRDLAEKVRKTLDDR